MTEFKGKGHMEYIVMLGILLIIAFACLAYNQVGIDANYDDDGLPRKDQ
jgi:hypothetical protein